MEIRHDREMSEALVSRLVDAMRREFGTDERRVAHALAVLGHARTLLRTEPADATVVAAAAVLHDIGIQEAERKHGSAAGVYQELEGPPIARRIMAELGLEAAAIEHVCRIVGSHHTAGDIDTVEFRILWDADWLVNIPDVYPDADVERLRQLIDQLFRTATGRALAQRMFLGGVDGWPLSMSPPESIPPVPPSAAHPG